MHRSSWGSLAAVLLLTGCASVPTYSVTLPGVAYASDPKDRAGWSARRMCYHLCRPALLRVSVKF